MLLEISKQITWLKKIQLIQMVIVEESDAFVSKDTF